VAFLLSTVLIRYLAPDAEVHGTDPSQVLAIRKSSSISIETGKEMDEVTPKPILRKKSLAYLLYRIMKFFEGKIQRRGE